jgi:hypothetical protein
VARASHHSSSPDAASDWIDIARPFLPIDVQPNPSHVREFANFFWTYITTSFDIIDQPGTRLLPGQCGCHCPVCATIVNAPHLQPKKLTKADKRDARELMLKRLAELASEESASLSPAECDAILKDPELRRCAAYSAYGKSLVGRLDGVTDGPPILALWREFAWTKLGSPIQGFKLRFDDFAAAEQQLIASI